MCSVTVSETVYISQYNELLLLADPELQAVAKYIHRARLFVCIQDGEAVGIAAVTDEGERAYELKNIAVREECRGRGIGKMLIAQIKAVTAPNRLIVGTADTDPGTIRFYERCGFKRFGRIQNFFIDHYQHEVIDNGQRCIDMIMLEIKECR